MEAHFFQYSFPYHLNHVYSIGMREILEVNKLLIHRLKNDKLVVTSSLITDETFHEFEGTVAHFLNDIFDTMSSVESSAFTKMALSRGASESEALLVLNYCREHLASDRKFKLMETTKTDFGNFGYVIKTVVEQQKLDVYAKLPASTEVLCYDGSTSGNNGMYPDDGEMCPVNYI